MFLTKDYFNIVKNCQYIENVIPIPFIRCTVNTNKIHVVKYFVNRSEHRKSYKSHVLAFY